MNLYEMYSQIKFICNKDFSGNIITPDRFKELIKITNLDHFRDKYGLPEEYQPGRPIPMEYVDVTLKNTDDLKAFRVLLTNTPVVSGVLPFPSNYAHRDEIVYNYTKTINGSSISLPRGVEILRETQLSERRGNYTKRPTTRNPCGVVRSNGIHIYPTTITQVDYYYFRWPIDPYFAYIKGDGFITYDSANSTELEWPKDEMIGIMRRCLEYIGVNLRESDIVNYAELKKREG